MYGSAGGGHVRGIVDGLLNRLESGRSKKGGAVLSAWRKSVDTRTAEHSRPVNFRNGVITVIVENSAWLYSLTLKKRVILSKFNEEYTGRKKASDIRFRVGSLEN